MKIECTKTSDDKYNIDIGNEIKFRSFSRDSVLEVLNLFKRFEKDFYTTYPDKLCEWDLSVTFQGFNIVTRISNAHHTYYTAFDKSEISEVVQKLTKDLSFEEIKKSSISEQIKALESEKLKIDSKLIDLKKVAEKEAFETCLAKYIKFRNSLTSEEYEQLEEVVYRYDVGYNPEE